MEPPAYLQQLKLEKLAQQVIPITAQLDKRTTHALAEVSAPQKSVGTVPVTILTPRMLEAWGVTASYLDGFRLIFIVFRIRNGSEKARSCQYVPVISLPWPR
jgi:hypothetical protein